MQNTVIIQNLSGIKTRGEEKMGEVNFEGFETAEDFVKIKAGIEKVLTISNPVRQDQTILEDNGETTKTVPGISFDVSEEDGQAVKKKLTVTSKRLVKKLRPYIESGRIGENTALKLKITKKGEGFDIFYEVIEA